MLLFFAGSGEWFKSLNLGCLIAVDCVPEVPVLLQTEPEIGRHSDHSLESQRGIGSDASLAADDFVQAWEGYAESLGKLRLRDLERDQEFITEHLAGMRWRPMTR